MLAHPTDRPTGGIVNLSASRCGQVARRRARSGPSQKRPASQPCAPASKPLERGARSPADRKSQDERMPNRWAPTVMLGGAGGPEEAPEEEQDEEEEEPPANGAQQDHEAGVRELAAARRAAGRLKARPARPACPARPARPQAPSALAPSGPQQALAGKLQMIERAVLARPSRPNGAPSVIVARDGGGPSRASAVVLLGALVALAALVQLALAGQPQPQQQQQPNEYQLIGHSAERARLPCLIGKSGFCGEPYFIAWYKLNASSRLWARIEAKSREQEDDETAAPRPATVALADERRRPAASSRPLAERIRFEGWSRETRSPSNCLQTAAAPGEPDERSALLLAKHQALGQSAASLAAYGQLFDCAQLTISALELQDEGQYKCEITFSDSLDPERCPASTATQLTVIGEWREAGATLSILAGSRAVVLLCCCAAGRRHQDAAHNDGSSGAGGRVDSRRRAIWPAALGLD